MAFRKKAGLVLAKRPDILIVPECEHPDKLIFKNDVVEPSDQFWYGKNQNKGLGIFSYSDFKIELLSIHNPNFRYVLPLYLTNGIIKLIIFAIWAQKPEKHNCYTEQIWNAVHFYDNLLNEDKVILIGDFNSSSIWDQPNRVYNHSNLVSFLENKDIHSTYHTFTKQKQGKETSSTFFMNRKVDRPYHIDFCFASKQLIDKMNNVEIGDYVGWIKISDHKPLIVDFEI